MDRKIEFPKTLYHKISWGPSITLTCPNPDDPTDFNPNLFHTEVREVPPDHCPDFVFQVTACGPLRYYLFELAMTELSVVCIGPGGIPTTSLLPVGLLLDSGIASSKAVADHCGRGTSFDDSKELTHCLTGSVMGVSGMCTHPGQNIGAQYRVSPALTKALSLRGASGPYSGELKIRAGLRLSYDTRRLTEQERADRIGSIRNAAVFRDVLPGVLSVGLLCSPPLGNSGKRSSDHSSDCCFPVREGTSEIPPNGFFRPTRIGLQTVAGGWFEELVGNARFGVRAEDPVSGGVFSCTLPTRAFYRYPGGENSLCPNSGVAASFPISCPFDFTRETDLQLCLDLRGSLRRLARRGWEGCSGDRTEFMGEMGTDHLAMSAYLIGRTGRGRM